MLDLNFAATWKRVVQNQNTWVLFEHGTVVIFLPAEAEKAGDLRAAAIERLKNLEVKSVAVAELVGQGMGWIVNCGNDFILNYLPHGDYASRYERIAAMIEVQKCDQQGLKIIHIQI